MTNALSAATIKALQSKEVKARYLELGVEAAPSEPVEFAKTLARESDLWKKVITDFKVVAQ